MKESNYDKYRKSIINDYSICNNRCGDQGSERAAMLCGIQHCCSRFQHCDSYVVCSSELLIRCEGGGGTHDIGRLEVAPFVDPFADGAAPSRPGMSREIAPRSRAVRRIARIWRVFKAHKAAVVCLQRFCRQYALKHRGLKRKRSHMLMCDE